MTSQHDKPKRWRLRFSVRTMVVVVTLVAVYFGLWEATKRHGVERVDDDCWDQSRWDQDGAIVDIRSPMPLVVEVKMAGNPDGEYFYFLWLPGHSIEFHST